ncbi:MAG: hypothetical protein WBV76_14270, partial [Pseudolabrys sp.]
ISLRMRTLEPTYLSVGFGDFFAIIWIWPATWGWRSGVRITIGETTSCAAIKYIVELGMYVIKANGRFY